MCAHKADDTMLSLLVSCSPGTLRSIGPFSRGTRARLCRLSARYRSANGRKSASTNPTNSLARVCFCSSVVRERTAYSTSLPSAKSTALQFLELIYTNSSSNAKGNLLLHISSVFSTEIYKKTKKIT